MKQQLNILINAYAVSPNWGSEPGMAWNWIVNLAKYCNLFVITEGEWRDEIEAAVAKHPYKDNIHFYYNPIGDEIRRMCWNQGDWRFYWYYRKWQKKTFEIARQIVNDNHIDVIHQLNMIGFREPGFLWKLSDVPYVWGPVGGLATVPTAYIRGGGWKNYLFYKLKNTISDLQLRYSPRVRAAAKRAILLAATKDGKLKLQQVFKKDVITMNETGCYKVETTEPLSHHQRELRLLWVGRFIPTKRLDIALSAIAKLPEDIEVKLDVVGPYRDEAQQKEIEQEVRRLGIEHRVNLHGKLPNPEVHRMMKESDAFLFTSIMEGTPHVILEAIQNSLPIVCFDTCGQGDVVNDSVGVKIPLTTPEQSVVDFANAIQRLYNNRDELNRLRGNCVHRQYELSWENKIKDVVELYVQLKKE